MIVFNDRLFLRHISTTSLREFTEQHVVGSWINMDWTDMSDSLYARICDRVQELEQKLKTEVMDAKLRKSIATDLYYWQEDLKRAHAMSNTFAVNEFRQICNSDPQAMDVINTREPKEVALWMLAFRDKAFRDAEHFIAFQAKTNGKYWKKHSIPPGLDPAKDREALEFFGEKVAEHYQKNGGGQSSHIELSERAKDGSIQLTIYVQGPVTAFAHFEDNQFSRLTTRVALETAIVYHPETGIVETVAKGGAKSHAAILQLFGEHVVGQKIEPEEIEKKRFHLNALRDGLLEPTVDWSHYGIQKVRLRRAKFSPRMDPSVGIQIEATPAMDDADAIQVALKRLKCEANFEMEYDLDGATVIVYLTPDAKGKVSHFSFGIHASGSSTVKNLSERNQPIAKAVLEALEIIDSHDLSAQELEMVE
jgi:hypothetical protein